MIVGAARAVSDGLRLVFRPVARFAARNAIPWELVMAALAIAYVLVGFAADSVTGSVAQSLAIAETVLTVVFLFEFIARFLGAERRLAYLRGHFLDLIALLPLARGLRAARLIRLLRFVRTFAGLRRAFVDVDRLSQHHGLGTLVIAWVGTMFLSSTVFYAVESEVNPGLRRPEDGLWWAIATLTGGATEITAVTDEGRLATAALLIIGVALFTAITASLVSYLVSDERRAARPTVTARLRELNGLRDAALISEAEFEAKRRDLIDRL